MEKKKLTRRDFLRMSALTAAGVVAAQCGTPATQAPPAATEAPAAATEAPAAAAPPAEEVTLDFVTIVNEYAGPYRQIWDIFQEENPGIKMKVLTENMDTLPAYNAKRAGGYFPALEDIWLSGGERTANRDNYERWVDLSTTEFPWWDRWTYDVKNRWPDVYRLPGPRSVDPFQGNVVSFMYRVDAMDKVGWDPQKEVKTLDDLKKLCEDLRKFAEEDASLDYGWDMAWHTKMIFWYYLNYIPLVYPDGSLERQLDCFMGKAEFNAEDSPWRHTFELLQEFLNNGWHPENWWNREWEPDMETSYIAGKSAMMLHGPWPWDKAIAADPDVEQKGFPLVSLDGEHNKIWVDPPPFDQGYGIPSENEELPVYEQVKTAFYWWNSPAAVKMRAEAEGRNVEYKLDEPLVLSGPQWLGLMQYVGTEDWFSHAEYTSGLVGEKMVAGCRKGGSKGAWDWGAGGMNKAFGDTVAGLLSIQEFLDEAQANWEESYDKECLAG
jgi:ABC-type glycerol-3-phosphate transport system substrate-binding protein